MRVLLPFWLPLNEGVLRPFAAPFVSSVLSALAGVFASGAGGGAGGSRRARARGLPDAPRRVGAFAGRGFGSTASGSSSVRGRLSLLRRVTMDLGAEDVVVTCGSGSAEEESASPGRGSRDVDRISQG